MSIWYCKIGTLHEIDLPNGADWPMRKAIRQAFAGLTGQDDEFCFSGWSAELTECELAVVENREPVRELVANESPEMLRAELAAERERADRAEAAEYPLYLLNKALAAEAERDALRNKKDGAYLERNQCVALIARMALTLGYDAGIAKTAIEGWSDDWHGCVYIDLPTGQVSWHYHDSQAHLFDWLPPYTDAWDGHDTAEKYRRVMAVKVPV